MRNLKRVLSLALAAMMLIGMMVVGASAANAQDFGDYGEIQHKEAVSTMVALGVIDGFETADGNTFKPEGTLKRSEMSKIISYIMSGGVEPSWNVGATPAYSDVDDHWAEKYIEFCTNMGIIAGVGNGKFNPEGTLTGEQAAKMLLTAMGYNADVFGFVGTGWNVNVNRYANEAGLYNGLSGMNPSQPISRDDACQLAYNAIQGTMMQRTWGQNVSTGEVTENYVPWVETRNLGGVAQLVNVTLLLNKFDANMYEGVLAATGDYDLITSLSGDGNDGADANGFVVNVERVNNTAVATGNTYFEYDEDLTDLMGQYLKVLCNDKTGEVYSLYTVTDRNTVLDTATSLTDFAGLNNKVKVDGETYSLESDIITIVGNDESSSTTFNGCVARAENAARASKVRFIDNDGNGKFDVALITPVDVAEITFKNDSNITFTPVIGNEGGLIGNVLLNGRSQSVEDMILSDDLAIGDYAVLSPNYYSDSDTLTEVEVLSGTVSGVRNPINAGQAPYNDYQIDDVWTTIADDDVPNSNIKSGSAVDYIAVNNVLFYVKLTSKITLDELAVIYDMGVDTDAFGDNVLKAKVALADQSTKEVTIAGLYDDYDDDKTDDNDVDLSDGIVAEQAYMGYVMSYEVNNDGKYELYKLSDSNDNRAGFDEVLGVSANGNDESIGAERPNSEWTIDGVQVADEAIIVVRSAAPGVAGKVKILTGSDFKKITGETVGGVYKFVTDDGAYAVVGKDSDGFTRVLFGTVQATAQGFDGTDFTLGTITGSSFGYLTKASWSGKEDGVSYNYFEIWNGTETVTVKEKASAKNYVAGSVITFNDQGDGVVKSVQQIGGAGAITAKISNNRVEIDGITYDIDSDTVILNVDDARKEGVSGTTTNLADKIAINPDRYDLNVYYQATNGTLDVLVVDVDDNVLDSTVENTWASIAGDFNSANVVEINGNMTATGNLTIPAGKTLVVRGTLDLNGNTVTTNGVLLAYNLDERGGTLNGTGIVNIDGNLTLRSTIGGKVTVYAETATLAGSVVIEDTAKVVISGTMTTTNAGPLTLKGGDLQIGDMVNGGATGTIVVDGENITLKVGNITGNVTVNAGATGTVSLGNVTGTVTNNSADLTVNAKSATATAGAGSVVLGSAGGTVTAGSSLAGGTFAGNLQAAEGGTTVTANTTVKGTATGSFTVGDNVNLTVGGVQYAGASSDNTITFDANGAITAVGANITATATESSSAITVEAGAEAPTTLKVAASQGASMAVTLKSSSTQDAALSISDKTITAEDGSTAVLTVSDPSGTDVATLTSGKVKLGTAASVNFNNTAIAENDSSTATVEVKDGVAIVTPTDSKKVTIGGKDYTADSTAGAVLSVASDGKVSLVEGKVGLANTAVIYYGGVKFTATAADDALTLSGTTVTVADSDTTAIDVSGATTGTAVVAKTSAITFATGKVVTLDSTNTTNVTVTKTANGYNFGTESGDVKISGANNVIPGTVTVNLASSGKLVGVNNSTDKLTIETGATLTSLGSNFAATNGATDANQAPTLGTTYTWATSNPTNGWNPPAA